MSDEPNGDNPRDEIGDALSSALARASDDRIDELAHELWAVAQLGPREGILDGVERIVAILTREARAEL